MANNMFDKMRDNAKEMANDAKEKMEAKKAEHDASKKKDSDMDKGNMPDKPKMM